MGQLFGQGAMFRHAELDGLTQHMGGINIYDQSKVRDGKVRFRQLLSMLKDRVHL